MTAPAGTASLVDAVDLLLNRGALLSGEATLSLAGVDLVYVGLNLLITSVETMQQRGLVAGPGTPARLQPAGPRPLAGQMPGAAAPRQPLAGFSAEPAAMCAEPQAAALSDLVERTGASGERPEQGLARLVLALVELLRQLVERQAVRRMEGGTLADADVERMGLALRELERTMTVLREAFGLTAEDINLDLGPLGRLLDDAP
jgi:hypothetical protein